VAIGFDERTKLPDEETLNRIEARFMGRYSGEINANKPLFIPPGAEVKKLHLSPHEMAYCESSEQMRDMILAAFGVPAAIANVSGGMTYGSVAATQAGYYMGTINPLYRFYGLNVSEKVAPRWRQGPADVLRVWWEDRTPEDPELREKTIVTDFSVGAITPQEVRQMRGREPYPHGGDNPFIQGAFVELPYATGRRELPAAPAVNAPPPEPPARPHGPDNPAGAGPAAEPDEPGDRLE
jgi:phage portal protein BeeE